MQVVGIIRPLECAGVLMHLPRADSRELSSEADGPCVTLIAFNLCRVTTGANSSQPSTFSCEHAAPVAGNLCTARRASH